MFLTLIRKDLRMLRPVLLAALVVALFLEVLTPAIAAQRPQYGFSSNGYRYIPRDVWTTLWDGSRTAAALSAAFSAVFASAVMTTERRERWSDLTAMLPVRKARRLAATGMTAFALSFLMLGIHALLYAAVWHHFWSLGWARGDARSTYESDSFTIGWYAAMETAMFGLGWLLASFLRSPTLAAVLAIAIPFGAFVLAMEFRNGRIPDDGSALLWSFLIVPVAVGLLAIAAGALIGIRRVEP